MVMRPNVSVRTEETVKGAKSGVSECKIRSSETHIAPESPRNFFAEFDTPISVQSGTSVDLSGSWRSFSHF